MKYHLGHALLRVDPEVQGARQNICEPYEQELKNILRRASLSDGCTFSEIVQVSPLKLGGTIAMAIVAKRLLLYIISKDLSQRCLLSKRWISIADFSAGSPHTLSSMRGVFSLYNIHATTPISAIFMREHVAECNDSVLSGIATPRREPLYTEAERVLNLLPPQHRACIGALYYAHQTIERFQRCIDLYNVSVSEPSVDSWMGSIREFPSRVEKGSTENQFTSALCSLLSQSHQAFVQRCHCLVRNAQFLQCFIALEQFPFLSSPDTFIDAYQLATSFINEGTKLLSEIDSSCDTTVKKLHFFTTYQTDPVAAFLHGYKTVTDAFASVKADLTVPYIKRVLGQIIVEEDKASKVSQDLYRLILHCQALCMTAADVSTLGALFQECILLTDTFAIAQKGHSQDRNISLPRTSLLDFREDVLPACKDLERRRNELTELQGVLQILHDSKWLHASFFDDIKKLLELTNFSRVQARCETLHTIIRSIMNTMHVVRSHFNCFIDVNKKCTDGTHSLSEFVRSYGSLIRSYRGILSALNIPFGDMRAIRSVKTLESMYLFIARDAYTFFGKKTSDELTPLQLDFLLSDKRLPYLRSNKTYRSLEGFFSIDLPAFACLYNGERYRLARVVDTLDFTRARELVCNYFFIDQVSRDSVVLFLLVLVTK